MAGGEGAVNFPLPLFAGEEGPAAKRWEVRVCAPDPEKTLTSQAFGLGPSSPVKNGRGK
jgi:hypothetical protein